VPPAWMDRVQAVPPTLGLDDGDTVVTAERGQTVGELVAPSHRFGQRHTPAGEQQRLRDVIPPRPEGLMPTTVEIPRVRLLAPSRTTRDVELVGMANDRLPAGYLDSVRGDHIIA